MCWSDKQTERAKTYHILLDDVSIHEISFMPEFIASIERKQVAQQEAEKYKFIVAMSEEEARAKIIEAEGNSIAAANISKAIEEFGTGVLELKKLEAAKFVAEKLSQSNNIAFIPGQGNLLLNLNK